ncbi:Saccharopine dehydrogenase [Porites harrisoni]
MHHLTMLVLIVSGIVLCMADPSYSNACNCHCAHTYYCASTDDCSKALYGSKANPGFSCKDINTNNGKQNGIYWIRLTDDEKPFPVYCDMAAGGWTMAFKAVSGVNKNVYSTYTSDQTSSEKVFAALEVTNRHFNHYKNRIVLKWQDSGPTEARVVLYKGGKVMKELKFDAKGSDKLNWFSLSRLTQSSWTDMKTQPNNFFSIRGDPGNGRHFFINSVYAGCPKDAGWMVITVPPDCDWEKRFRPGKNVILYSKLSGLTNWNQYGNVEEADVLAVYLR